MQSDIGIIQIVRAEIPLWRDQSCYDELGQATYIRDSGGVLISQAIHTLDFLRSIAGPLTSVQALCATSSFHDEEAGVFSAETPKFDCGVVGSLVASAAGLAGATMTGHRCRITGLQALFVHSLNAAIGSSWCAGQNVVFTKRQTT